LPEEARIYAGLKALVEQILSRNYVQSGTGQALRVELGLVDSGKWTDVVYQFCDKSPFRDRLQPSKGRGIKAGDKPMNEYRHDPRRDKRGDGWRIDAESPARGLVLYDTNHWKTFTASRLAAPFPIAGCLTLNGIDPINGGDPREHELFASHVTAEYQVETSGYGRELREWKHRPERNDNHYWDALVLSAVAASVRGLVWNTAAVAGDATTTAPKPKRSLADIEAERRAARGGRIDRPRPAPSSSGTAPAATPPADGSKPKRSLADIEAERRARRKRA
jgi:hypothetical protein